MGLLSLFLVLAADEPAESLAKTMLPVYVKEIADYSLAVESAPKKELELVRKPVLEWSNPVRQGLQQGVIFLWLRDGRPAAVGCIFSEPEGRLKGRKVIHEFHALDRDKLLVSRPPDAWNEWKPQAGLERKELPDAGVPAATPGARQVQMRRLAQEFTGHMIGGAGKRWELRLLPAPLYRYPSAETGVIDGALFTLVSEAGTDPEVLLLIEAHKVGETTRWEYALARFTDGSVYVQRKGKEVWSLVRSDTNTFLHDPQHTYRTYADKVVSNDGKKLLANVRATPEEWWGHFYPVNEK
jgi:hypothetical protein